MSCLICCEVFNKSNRTKIVCNYCEFENCRSCFQKYLLETIQDPHCMECKKVFTRDFLKEKCTNVFINVSLKNHRENILFEREKSLLPETQPYVILEKEKKIVLAKIKLIDDHIDQLRNQILEALTEKSVYMNQLSSVKVVPEKFTRKCPMNECRGFLNNKWICGICDTKICSKCNEKKEDDHLGHRCTQENIDTMILINKDTKPCPNCGTMIHKISGCSQVWCTECHTAYNWHTSVIETGVIHNPHYYEFIKKSALDIPRTECNAGLMNLYTLQRKIIKYITRPELDIVHKFHRTINHITNTVINYYHHADNRELRIKFLMDIINTDEFKKNLQIAEKKNEKIRSFNGIYRMFTSVGQDICLKIYNEPTAFNEHIITINNLIEYFNTSLESTAKVYNCVCPGIDDYDFVTNKLLKK